MPITSVYSDVGPAACTLCPSSQKIQEIDRLIQGGLSRASIQPYPEVNVIITTHSNPLRLN